MTRGFIWIDAYICFNHSQNNAVNFLSSDKKERYHFITKLNKMLKISSFG